MSINNWYAEVMAQDVASAKGKDFTRLAFMLFFLEKTYEHWLQKHDINELVNFIYRFYIDNEGLANEHSAVLIKKIRNYNPKDIENFVIEQLNIWSRVGKGILQYDRSNVWLDLELNELQRKSVLMTTKQIVEKIFVKYLGRKIEYNSDILLELKEIRDELKHADDSLFTKLYDEKIAQGRFRSRLFEQINYCPLCECTDTKKLRAVHIKDFLICSDEEMKDANNGILVCEDHYKLFIRKIFNFDERGKVVFTIPLTTEQKKQFRLDERMRLSNWYCNDERKRYLKGL